MGKKQFSQEQKLSVLRGASKVGIKEAARLGIQRTSLSGADRPNVTGVGLIFVTDNAIAQVQVPRVGVTERGRGTRPVVVLLNVVKGVSRRQGRTLIRQVQKAFQFESVGQAPIAIAPVRKVVAVSDRTCPGFHSLQVRINRPLQTGQIISRCNPKSTATVNHLFT